MEEKEYQKKIETLLNDITAICGGRSIDEIPMEERYAISAKIMARLREEFIYVKNSYINEFKTQDVRVTIDPFNEEVKLELKDGEREGIGSGEYCRVYANSFGPFNPKEYFNKDIKIVWILKEPLVQDGEYSYYENGVRDDLGRHNQAEEYGIWMKQFGKFDSNTHDNLLQLSRIILQELKVIKESNPDEQVMNHICIIEANHFLGLSFNGNWKTDDQRKDNPFDKWLRINATLIKILIEFYSPRIIVGCWSFMGYFTPDYDLLNWLSANDCEDPYKIEDKEIDKEIFGKKIIKSWKGTDKHSLSKTSNNKFWINAYHPSVYIANQPKILMSNIENFAEYIYADIMLNSKVNGMTESSGE